MNSISASAAGQFRIGDITINRLGYGAMRLTGRGIWGAPADRGEALATLRRLPEIAVNFIDTADSYGPNVSEELIREALHPYDGLLIATKAGFTRPGPDRWVPNGRPAYLIGQAKSSSRDSASSGSISGNCIVSIRECPVTNNSVPCVNSWTTASSSTRD